MSDEKFKRYIIYTITLLKKQAIEAKKDADSSNGGLKDYYQGVLMGYYSIINLLKHQAFVFCMDQKELGLSDIKPDIDLLGLHRNPNVDFGEDNWTIDAMDEAKVKGYLSDSIKLLKEQVLEAKKNADNLKEGSKDYSKGEVMAYHQVISLLKHQASAFNIDQKQLDLADIAPE